MNSGPGMNSGPFHPNPDLALQRSGFGWNGPEFTTYLPPNFYCS
jgi:hypothetical protein